MPDIKEKIQKTLRVMKNKPIIKEAFEKLKIELPKNLIYHTPTHTEDVLREAFLFALTDNMLSDDELNLLAIAAAYHDIGFIKTKEGHEEIGAQIAGEAMQKFNYSQNEIKLVKEAIEDTKIYYKDNRPFRNARNSLSRYLLDADLSNFGKLNFKEKSDQVFKESGSQDRIKFIKSTINLIMNHQWYTEAAKTLRKKQKKENITNLIQKFPPK